MIECDVLIIGGGLAGLTAALEMGKDLKVGILTKAELKESSSYYAQGGIAAVMDIKDHFDAHIQDTLECGAGLCDEKAVRFCVAQAPACIEWLASLGVPFSTDKNGEYHLTQEGGHSHRRIVHAEDATGKAVHGTLQSAVRHHPNITIYEHHLAVDLIRREGRVVGAYVYDEVQKKVKVFASRAVLLATGGASRAYLYSTNPAVSSGDGIAMAHRAGAKTQDLEFNQFHPTCLYHPHAGSFLISEAVRGEGGKLILPDGTRFMPQFDPRAELAPRDIVARAIDFEMKRLGLDCVYLDIRHRGKAFIVSHFPNIYARCLDLGIDITTEPIPVVPAAHYTCGGVVVDEHARTTIRGLYAAGEAARTGLHGANRLASNSLLECMVYGKAAAFDIRASLPAWPLIRDLPAWDESQVSDSNEAVLITQNWDELRRMMWSYVGIVRSQKRLARARARIELLKREVQEYYGHFRVTRDLLELRNLVVVADLIIQACLERPESIGLHYMV